MLDWILNIHTFASGIMAGLVWFVQINHYPLFLYINAEDFPKYEEQHVRRTGWIVAPTMLIELCACIGLACLHPSFWFSYVNSALVITIWLSTFFIQMPIHGRLRKMGKADHSIRTLIFSNWLRTITWTVVFVGLLLNR